MKALLFDIVLEQPVTVSRASSGDENSSETYSFIPGSVIRGAIIGSYLRKNADVDISENDFCRDLFFNATTQYLNAYPTMGESMNRMLPIPLSWRVQKDDRYLENCIITDFAIDEDYSILSPVLPGADFVFSDKKSVVYLKNSKKAISPHNASLNRQKKTSGESFVFQYESLVAGQRFKAVVIGENAKYLLDSGIINNEQILFLGGSKSANYGRVSIENVHLDENWKEVTFEKKQLETKIIVTLLSDGLFFDNLGNQVTQPFFYFGCNPVASYIKTGLIGGFNRKWGLPLPQWNAVQAGSVFVYNANELNIKNISKFEEYGVGERRAEGFGRIAINWFTDSNLHRLPIKYSPGFAKTSNTKLRNTSKILAQKMVERQYLEFLNQRILEISGLIKIEKQPQKAQLSRMREMTKKCIFIKDLAPLREYLHNLKRVGSWQFENANIEYHSNGKTQFYNWLSDGVSEDFSSSKNFWKLLNPIDENHSIAGEKISNLTQIQNEYIARFIEILLKYMIKNAQREEIIEGEE